MKLLTAIIALSLLLGTTITAKAQSQTLPPNTVLGRTGISAGPAQAIPFATLSNLLLSDLNNSAYSQQNSFAIIGMSLPGAFPPNDSDVGLAISWNFSNGGAEVDFWNRATSFSPGSSFRWYQQTAASSAKLFMELTGTGSLKLAPNAASTTKGLDILQSGPTSGALNANLFFNYLHITSDASNVGSGHTSAGLEVEYHFGGANTSGQHAAGAFDAWFDQGATSVGNINRAAVALLANTHCEVSDAGAGMGCFGFNITVGNDNGSTNSSVNGEEIDVGNSGVAGYVLGTNWVKDANSNVGTTVDAAAIVGAGPSAGWKCGYCFWDGNNNGTASPITSTGTLIGAYNTGASTPWAVAKGIDFSNFTFSGNVFTSTNFLLTGGGDVQLRHLGAGHTTPTANSCAGFSLGTGSSDTAGKVSLTSATSCSVNFQNAFGNAPFCAITPGSATSTTEVTTTTGGFAATFGTAQTAFMYQCIGI